MFKGAIVFACFKINSILVVSSFLFIIPCLAQIKGQELPVREFLPRHCPVNNSIEYTCLYGQETGRMQGQIDWSACLFVSL